MVLSPLREEATKIRELILNGDTSQAEGLLSGMNEKYTKADETAYLDFVKNTLEVVKSHEADWSTEANRGVIEQMLRKVLEEHLERSHALYLPRMNRVRLPHGAHLALIDFENDVSRLKRRESSLREHAADEL